MSVFMGFKVPCWVSRFQVDFFGSRLDFHGSRWLFMVIHSSRSQARSETLRVPQKILA